MDGRNGPNITATGVAATELTAMHYPSLQKYQTGMTNLKDDPRYYSLAMKIVRYLKAFIILSPLCNVPMFYIFSYCY